MKLAIFLAMSTTVNIAEFKDRFSELLAAVEKGDTLLRRTAWPCLPITDHVMAEAYSLPPQCGSFSE